MRSDSRLSVVDLLRRPGTSRTLALELDPPGDLPLPLVDAVGPLRLEGVLESVVDGLLVRGRLHTRVALACARCLSPMEAQVSADVAELYSDPAELDSPEDLDPGYEISEGQIDLDTLLRDTLVPAVPVAPHCRDDCAGLCATCGADRNLEDCDCVEVVSDTRWTALEGLRLADDRFASN